MATIDVLNWQKKKVDKVDLNAEVFEKPYRSDIIHSVVRWQLACRRQGTHAAKTKGLVRGGGRKPFKQKGTGNARQGSSRSPLMPGGGVIFGPQPRDYSFSLTKKVRQLGLKVALSQLLRDGRLFVVDEMTSEGKTNELAKRIAGFGLKKVILVDSEGNEKFSRAAKNLPNARYYSAEGVNVYDLLKYNTIVMTKSAVAAIEGRCGVKS